MGIRIEGQEGLTLERWFRLAQTAEDMGFESLCRSDHLTGLGGVSKRPSLETWTSLTALALRSRRIRFGAMVSPLTFYHPAFLAKMAAAVDNLSGGRLDLGLGAGWNEHEHKMFGVPFFTLKERLDRLEAGARGIARPSGGSPSPSEPIFLSRNLKSILSLRNDATESSSAGAGRSARSGSSPSSPTSGT